MDLGHVVFVDTTLAIPPTGGAHSFLVDLCAGLRARGILVSVVTRPGRDQRIAEALRANGVTLLPRLWSGYHLPEEAAKRLGRWVNHEKPDAYVVSASPDAGWLALPHLDAAIPTVSIAHNDVEAFYAPLRYYAPFVDCAVAVSGEIHRKIVGSCGMPPGRAARIPYGVRSLSESEVGEHLTATRGEGPLLIGYVGRLVESQKRVSDLPRLAVGLKVAGISFRLEVVGDGPERAGLEGAFGAAGVAEAVRFWGWVPRQEALALVAKLDVLVLLSDYEGLPMVVLEAMAHAVVPVVTRIASGNTELVADGIDGYAVPVGDIAAFVDRLTTLARSTGRLTAMKRAAWDTARRYSLDRMVENYCILFEGLLARPADGKAPRPRGSYPVMPSCRSVYPRWSRKLKAFLRTAVRG